MRAKYFFCLVLLSFILFAETDKELGKPSFSSRELKPGDVELNDLPEQDCFGIQILGINRDERIVLDRTTWADLTDLKLTCVNSESSPVLVNFSTQVSDRVSGYYGGIVSFRLVRDGEEISQTSLGFTLSPFFSDFSSSISFTDTPEAGEHIYKIQYKLNTSVCRAFAQTMNLQIYTK